MADFRHGTITVELAEEMKLPEKAGKMDRKEVARIPKAPRGLGVACNATADAIEKAGEGFLPPLGVTPEGLRLAGEKAEKIDQIIRDGEVVLRTLKQANLIFDHDAYEQLRKLNDQVKAQAKHSPEYWHIFKSLLDFFSKVRRTNPSSLSSPSSPTSSLPVSDNPNQP